MTAELLNSTEGREVRQWRIEVITAFPQLIPSEGWTDLPAQLALHSRVRAQSVQVANVTVKIHPYSGPLRTTQDWGMWEPVLLRLELEAPDTAIALEICTPWLGLILDDLSFQLQEPLRAMSLEVLDITPPLSEGEQREFQLFPFPIGYDQFKLARSTPMGTTSTVAVPILQDSYDTLPERVQDALDWYIKGLHSPFDADKFVFFWICFEILRGISGTKIEVPTKLRCGCTIDSCPKCQKPTSQPRQKEMAVGFLAELHVEEDVAKRLWEMRMLVHGEKELRFTPEALADLGESLQVLRAAALLGLKRAMGKKDDESPTATSGRIAVGESFALGGLRLIEEEDL